MLKLITLTCTALLLSACSSMPWSGKTSGSEPSQLGTTATMGASGSGAMRNGDGPN